MVVSSSFISLRWEKAKGSDFVILLAEGREGVKDGEGKGGREGRERREKGGGGEGRREGEEGRGRREGKKGGEKGGLTSDCCSMVERELDLCFLHHLRGNAQLEGGSRGQVISVQRSGDLCTLIISLKQGLA